MASTEARPLVTVVIPSYDAGPYLRASVESILAQTYRELEILLIDDGSTDGSVDAIADLDDPRLQVLRQENQGKPAAVNRVLDLARGDYYVLQDADDVSHPRRVERLVARLEADPTLAGAFSGYDLIIDGRHTAPRFREKSAAECAADIARFAMPSHDPTAMYRMSMVGELRYAEDLPIGEGHDYILRVGESHPLVVVGECLYSYRLLESSLTHSDPDRRRRYVREVLDRACARRNLDPAILFTPHLTSDRIDNTQQDNNLVAHYLESAVDQRRSGDVRGAVRTALSCARLHPFDPVYYKPLALAILPHAIGQRLRRSAES